MKKRYLLTALLLGGLMLSGCGGDNPSTDGQSGTPDIEEGVKLYNLNFEYSCIAPVDEDTNGNKIELTEGSVSGAVGATLTFKITLMEGYEVTSLKFNGVDIEPTETHITPVEGDNTLEIVFTKIGYIPAE